MASTIRFSRAYGGGPKSDAMSSGSSATGGGMKFGSNRRGKK